MCFQHWKFIILLFFIFQYILQVAKIKSRPD